MENYKKQPKFVGISEDYPYLLNIKANKTIELKKLLQDFSLIQAGMITDIIYLCQKKKTNSHYKSITAPPERPSFQRSWGIDRSNIHKNIKSVLDRKTPPLIKIKGEKPTFKINYDYFNKLYNKDFKSAAEIYKEHKLYQDSFLTYCYGLKRTMILELILFKMRLNEGFLLPLSIKKISRELHISYPSVYAIIKKMSYKLTQENIEELRQLETEGLSGKGGIILNSKIKFRKPTHVLGIFSTRKRSLIYIDTENIIKFQRYKLEKLLKRKVKINQNLKSEVNLEGKLFYPAL